MNFHGEKRANDTHESTTDPDARLARKGDGQAAQLSYCGSLLMDNRHGLPVDVDLRMASGTAERDAAAELMRGRGGRGVTLGADKAYDTRGLVAAMRAQGVTPHVAQNPKRSGGSAIDGRTTRHAGYAISQQRRKLVEECFGWMKTVGLFAQKKHRGVERVGWCFAFLVAANLLVRLQRLIAPPVPLACA